MHESPAPDIVPDIFDPRIYAAGLPHTAYQTLRDNHPVSWQQEYEVLGWPAGPGFWAVTRHADVVQVLKDPRTYSSHLGATQIRDPAPSDLPFIRRMMLNQDPPDHGRLRRVISHAFTPRRIDRFESAARERARSLLTAAIAAATSTPSSSSFATSPTCDFVTTITDEYALLNLADLLGVPPSDRSLLLDWTRRVIGYQDPEESTHPHTPHSPVPINPRSPAALQDMFDFARQLAAYKRHHPADDVMTALALDTTLDAPELDMSFFLLTIAGNDTVRSAAPGGLLALAQHPDAYQHLRTHGVDHTSIDELLRWHPPVLSFRRTATRDTDLSGQRIKAGDKVVVFHGSANYDDRAFANPHQLNLRRTANQHVAFGDGPHICLGAHFARLQLRVLYEETCKLLPTLTLAAPPRRLISNFINGIKSLPLHLTTD